MVYRLESPFHRKGYVAVSQKTGGCFCMTAAGNTVHIRSEYQADGCGAAATSGFARALPARDGGMHSEASTIPLSPQRRCGRQSKDWRLFLYDGRWEHRSHKVGYRSHPDIINRIYTGDNAPLDTHCRIRHHKAEYRRGQHVPANTGNMIRKA